MYLRRKVVIEDINSSYEKGEICDESNRLMAANQSRKDVKKQEKRVERLLKCLKYLKSGKSNAKKGFLKIL